MVPPNSRQVRGVITMVGKLASAVVVSLALLAGGAPAMGDTPDPATGKIAGYTYGESAYNSYTSWSGGFLWIWQFSSQHIGVAPNPVAGSAFYLHAHTAIIAPHNVTGNVLLTIDQDAGGLPLRVAPTASMPLVCSRTQFDPIVATSPATCRATVSLESGQYVVSNLEPLVPGFAFDVLVPVVVDSAATGTAAMTAMWASPDVTLSINNVMASVPVTVAAAPVTPTPTPTPTTPTTPSTKPLPKKLRKYKKVRSLTPAVCTVANRRVVIHSHGLCKLKARKIVVKKYW